jgi:site-specific DNA-methyltransferase (cytosine-N4-specific)
METTHEVHVDDARDLPLPDNSVDLVVTSPPYPMISIWDDLFASLDSGVGDALDDGDGHLAHERMHDVLDDAWREVARVLSPGGIACVNVGDATRTLDRFRVYDNHARVTEAFEGLGFDALPGVLWRKPANSAAKFMGSGMLPPNAYVTQEHEHVLVFRNGERRSFDARADRRYEAAYFWEERNRWFSDVWTDLNGETQTLPDSELRERSAAFPLALPYRLVNMYSVYGDTVLDPFWGTGTTSLAAAVAGRNSVGVERDPGFADAFAERIHAARELSRELARDRLSAHRSFVQEADTLDYEAEHYDTPVRTKQERRIRFYEVTAVSETDVGWRATHRPYEE